MRQFILIILLLFFSSSIGFCQREKSNRKLIVKYLYYNKLDKDTLIDTIISPTFKIVTNGDSLFANLGGDITSGKLSKVEHDSLIEIIKNVHFFKKSDENKLKMPGYFVEKLTVIYGRKEKTIILFSSSTNKVDLICDYLFKCINKRKMF